MLFNSIEFLIFFPSVTFLYFALPYAWRNPLLLASSCLFYMAFVPAYILILFFTILVDYFAGISIEHASGHRRKLLLIISLIANIGTLAVFKYFNFLNENLTAILHTVNFHNPIPALSILLPIGLSFHTFQAMSYTIEVYWGKQKAEKNFLNYALYVMFYPQLVAGPIERPQNLLGQFREKHQFEYERVISGLRLMLWGFLKKIVLADRLAIAANSVFSAPEQFHGLSTLLAIYSFTFQIYLDFSAYSDIARGAAEVMGFRLMKNFNAPYLAASLEAFWRRWHISLSTWFKDYLYVPLGGNRGSSLIRQRNLLIVFLVSGLWHGASWNFVIWGGLHGFALVILNVTKNIREAMARTLMLDRMPKTMTCLSTLLTFHFVAFAWIFFRANNLGDALIMIKSVTNLENAFTLQQFEVVGLSLFEIMMSVALVVVLLVLEHGYERHNPKTQMKLLPAWARWAGYYIALAFISFFGVLSKQQFIYFQF